MRELIKQWPPILLRRWLLTIAAGIGFLLVGTAVWLAAQDRVMLLLSGVVFLLTLGRAVLLFRCFVLGNYVVLEGICIQITQIPLQRCRKIRLLGDTEEEFSLFIGKQHAVQVGNRYRFYLQRSGDMQLPGMWLTASLRSGNLLGVEQIGDGAGNS